jgi:large subunit ribosomal protein L10
MPTEKKRSIVARLSEDLGRSTLLVLTDYRGITMKELTTVRRNLEKAGVGYHVVKNTLLRLALGDDVAAKLDPYLQGPTAVVFAFEDPVVAAKALSEQASAYTQIKVKGGWLEGQAVSPDRLRDLATLPSRTVLLAQLLGTVQAPVAHLVGGLSSVVQQLLYVLQQRAEQNSEVPAAAEAA